MVDIAQEQVDTTEVVEPTEDAVEVTDEQLDADFNDDDETVAPKPDEQSAEEIAAAAAAEAQTPEEKAAAEAAASTVVEKTEEEKATEAAAEAKTVADAAAAKVASDKEAAVAVAKPEPTAEETAAAETKFTEEREADLAQFLENMTESLKDVEIGDGGTEEAPMPKTLGEFAEQFPEITNGMKTMIGHLRDQMISQMAPIQERLESQAVTTAQEALFAELGNETFGHTDASDIINSDGYEEWVDKQSPAYQQYVTSVNTAQDAAPVLARYKAEAGIETAAPTAAQLKATEQREAKTAKDKLHSATTRTKKSVDTTAGKGDSQADLDAAWDEDDKDEDI